MQNEGKLYLNSISKAEACAILRKTSVHEIKFPAKFRPPTRHSCLELTDIAGLCPITLLFFKVLRNSVFYLSVSPSSPSSHKNIVFTLTHNNNH